MAHHGSVTAVSVYRHRVLDEELDEVFRALSALAVEGPKGVGKTATAQRRAATVVRLDDPALADIAGADATRILHAPGPVLLDEWQRVPAVWDAVRRAVDDGHPPGPFLLTGSAVPADRHDDVQRHSGAGRIDVLRMRPMALSERLDAEPTVRLSALLDGETDVGGSAPLTLADYTGEIIRSGFPGIRGFEGRALRLRLDGYVERVIDRDFSDELGTTVRRPDTLRRWMSAYAAATSTTTSFEKIRGAATSTQITPAKATGLAYRDALVRLFILDPVDGWVPTRNHLKRLTQAAKHHLADPALAAALLGLTEAQLLSGGGGLEAIPRDGSFLGALFESLATLSVRVYAQAHEARVRHLRTAHGDREIDLIVEGRSGGVVALEVKLAATVNDTDVRHLRWLRDQIGDDLRAAVVLTTGPEAYRRRDGILVVPLALLGA
jgi:predicted AAA+ superfamily ATPase